MRYFPIYNLTHILNFEVGKEYSIYSEQVLLVQVLTSYR